MLFTIVFGALIVTAALVFVLSALGTEAPVRSAPGTDDRQVPAGEAGSVNTDDQVYQRLPPEYFLDDEHLAAKQALESQARRQLTRILS